MGLSGLYNPNLSVDNAIIYSLLSRMSGSVRFNASAFFVGNIIFFPEDVRIAPWFSDMLRHGRNLKDFQQLVNALALNKLA
jgi:hypothetical protein